MKIYLSGKMTGLPDYGFGAFREATAVLREQGHEVFSPHETDGGDVSKSWEYYMKIDIAEVTRSDAVVVLPGWETSKGVKEETRIARLLKIPVLSYPDLNPIEESGIKFDEEKIRLDLIPVAPLLELGKVLTFGALKYSPNNWRGGFKWSRTYAATLRHLFAWFSGETYDKETGINHLAHAMCNIVFLLEFANTHPELDDRIKTNE